MTSQFDPFAPSPPPLLSTLPHTKSLPTNATFQSTKSSTDDAKYDDDLFGLKSSGVGVKDERKSQPRGGTFGGDSTSLPTFGDFAHATYRTPFDSPDPIEEVVDQTQHIAVNPRVSQSALTSLNELDHQPGSSLSATTTITTIASSQPTSLFSMEAYDPLSIFHTVPQSTSKDLAKPELKKSQTTPVEGRKRSKSTTSASSSSSSTNTKPSTFSLPFDPVEEAVIPEILTSKELLARRASEPTLGSRRAALAAAAAREEQSKHLPPRKEMKAGSSSAKGSAHSSPRLASSRPAPLLHVDVTDRLSIPAASDVNLAGPFRDVSQGPVTPRRVCNSCNRMAFASNRCATHLLQQLRGDDTGEPTTPTTIIRRAHNLWRRSVEQSAFLSLKWEFWKKAERYVVQLWEDQLTGQRTVLVNGKVSYRGKPQESPWRLHIVLGRSKSSAFESIIGSINRGAVGSGEMIAGFNYDVGHEFELWIEGFPFTEARNNWLSELGVQHAIQAEDDEARSIAIHERHFKDLQYITKHWIRQDSVWKTAYGYKKNLIEWRFTLNGRKHLFSLTHSEVSGKRKLILDNRPILVKKPNLISGLIRKKSTSDVFECDGVEMEVMIHKVGGPLNSIHSALWSDGQQHPFVYELFIDRVSFSRCTKTLSDVAGGDFLIDDKLGQQKKEEMKRKKREAELRRDPRSLPSPDPET